MRSENNQEQRVQRILWEALKLSGDARVTYLEAACGEDSELRREVESLLEAEGQAGTFLSPQPPEATVAVPLAEKAGDNIGHYKLLEQIGEGGFGVVWMAEQQEPVRRLVALKIIKLGMDTKEVVGRFEAERQALAMMGHPNIARVFDGGATDAGRPYFVMELVKGVPITNFCDANKLSTRERLELFMQVCHAVQHAHQKGVIHRDLKPSNILVTVQDDRPVPKVIDFGVAKATQAQLTEKTVFTRFHQWMGTPAYMSPEQAGLGSFDIDTRSDVYSLGVLLYELLTGRPLFDTQKLLKAGYEAVMRTIREEEPPKPSTRLSTLAEEDLCAVAASRNVQPAKLSRLVRGELDWVVMKALEKDRTRRYETASALAQDLGHFLNQEPVSAAAPAMGYRLRKFARRNRLALSTAGLFVVLVLAGASVSTWQAVRATRFAREALRQERLAMAEAARARQLAVESETARHRADEEAAIAAAVNEFLNKDLLSRAVPVAEAEETPQPELKVRAVLDRASEKITGRFTNQPLVEASLRATMESAYHQLGAYETQEVHARRAAELYARELGETNVFALRMMEQWGDAERHLGRGMEAVRRLQHACELEERTVGPAHTNTLFAMMLLGVAYAEADQRDQGRALLEEALARAEQSPAAGGSMVSELLRNLGALLAQDGQLASAEQKCRRDLALTRERVGPAHPETIGSLFRLARVLSGEEKYAEAEALFREVIAASAKLGRTNDYDGTVLCNLGFVLAKQNKRTEAEAAFREALALRRAHGGPETPEVVDALARLAGVLVDAGRFAEAKPLLVEAMQILKHQPAIQNRESFHACSILVVALRAQGRQAELASALEDLAALLEQRPASSPGVAEAHMLLAAGLAEQGRLAEAEARLLGNWQPSVYTALKVFEGQVYGSPKPLSAERALQKLALIIDGASEEDRQFAWLTRAAVHGRLGRSKEAAANLARCSAGKGDLLRLALVPLWMDSGDVSTYEGFRRDLLDQYRRSPGHLSGPLQYTPDKGWESTLRREGDPATAAAVALALALYPNAQTYKDIDWLAEGAVELGAHHAALPRFQITLGLVEYRFGRFESTAEWARRSLAGTNVEPATLTMANAVLALARKRLGQPDAAAEAVQQAQELLRTNLPPVKDGVRDLGEHWPDWLIAQLLVKEALAPEGTHRPDPLTDAATNVLVKLDYFANRNASLMNSRVQAPEPPPGTVTRPLPDEGPKQFEPSELDWGKGESVSFPACIAAVVNESVILGSEVRKAVSPLQEARLRREHTNNPAVLGVKLRALQDDALQRRIEYDLILAEAIQAGRQIAKEHLDSFVWHHIQTNYYGDSNVFLKVLAARGMTLDQFRERHRRDDLVSAARHDKIGSIPAPSRQQVEDYYHAHEKDFRTDESVKLSLITIKRSATNSTAALDPSRKLAAEIRARIAGGEDFAEVARLYSQDGLAKNGGEWGWVEARVLRKELAEAAFSLQPGGLSEIIETEQALYLVRVVDRRPGAVRGMAEVRADILKALERQERSAVINDWLRGLRSRSFIRFLEGGVGVERPSEKVVSLEIRPVGVSTISAALTRSRLDVKEGELVTQANLDDDLRTLYGTGDFYNLRIAAETVPGGLKLIYAVQENPVLSDIGFNGNHQLSNADLSQKLASKPGERMEERKLFEDSQKIQALYHDAGYPAPAVKYRFSIDESMGRSSATFEIAEAASR